MVNIFSDLFADASRIFMVVNIVTLLIIGLITTISIYNAVKEKAYVGNKKWRLDAVIALLSFAQVASTIAILSIRVEENIPPTNRITLTQAIITLVSLLLVWFWFIEKRHNV